MKRRLTKLVVFLLLGAVINVAVAWRIWKREPFDPVIPGMKFRTTTVNENHRDLWHRYVREHWPQVPSSSIGQFQGVGIDVVSLSELDVPSATGQRRPVICRVWRTEIGWPLRTLAIDASYEVYHVPIHRIVPNEHSGMTVAGQLMPREILWVGFAINTTFYAAILWLLTFGPFTARRIIRHKRGRCIKCGYDLRGNFSAGCSECGWRRDEHTDRTNTIGS